MIAAPQVPTTGTTRLLFPFKNRMRVVFPDMRSPGGLRGRSISDLIHQGR